MRFMIFLDWMHSAMDRVIWNIFYPCNKHKAGWITAKCGSWYEITLSYKLEFVRKFSFVTMLLKRCEKKKIVCSAYPSLTRRKCQLQWEFPLGRHQGDWECSGQRWLPGSANQWDCSNPWRAKHHTAFSELLPFLHTLGTQPAQVHMQNLTLTMLRHWTFPTALRTHFLDKTSTVVTLQFSFCFALYIVRRFLL